VWGPDAMEFRPERWLESSSEKNETPLGVYGNLCVFYLLNRTEEELGLIRFRCKAYLLCWGKRLYRMEVCVSRRYFQRSKSYKYGHSPNSLKSRGDPGVLSDPHTRIQFLYTGGQERPNCTTWASSSYGRRGGRQGPSAPVDDHSSQRYLTSFQTLYPRASPRTRTLSSVSISSSCMHVTYIYIS
jgi:hypothetical protein